jgi:hypothetical protein
MAITNKLITFNKLTSFETQLAQGNILETSIVFIKDAKKIWTKGTYFDCSGGGSNDEIGYTTDFSVADIEAVYGRGITKPINVQGLISAIEANIPIIIPTNITDASQVGGNAVTMAKMENDGFIYLNVIVPYLDGVHKEYFIQIKITTAQLIKSGSNGSITLKELVARETLEEVEEVWATTYNKLNTKISEVQQYIYDEAASRKQFDEAIAEIQSIIAENESVVTAAWNQLNTRINALEAAQIS